MPADMQYSMRLLTWCTRQNSIRCTSSSLIGIKLLRTSFSAPKMSTCAPSSAAPMPSPFPSRVSSHQHSRPTPHSLLRIANASSLQHPLGAPIHDSVKPPHTILPCMVIEPPPSDGSARSRPRGVGSCWVPPGGIAWERTRGVIPYMIRGGKTPSATMDAIAHGLDCTGRMYWV
jgi:hypothetical protein